MATVSVMPLSHKSAATWQFHTAETLMLGMQGSLNLLTSSLANTATSTEDKVSACWELAMQMLHEQDNDLPKDVKAFIRIIIARNVGFTEVYTLTTDNDGCLDYVWVEVEGMRIKSNAGEPVPIALPNPF